MNVSMWSAFLVLGCGLLVLGDKGIDSGRWVVENMSQCPDPENYPIKFDVMRRKINRTHDAFYGDIVLEEEITESNFGVYIDACRKVDGGCKHQYTFNEASFCKFIKEHAEHNFKAVLAKAGVEDPDCPIPSGTFNLSDFVFNYLELPEKGMVGRFKVTCYLTRGMERHACLIMDVEFIPVGEDVPDDDDYDE